MCSCNHFIRFVRLLLFRVFGCRRFEKAQKSMKKLSHIDWCLHQFWNGQLSPMQFRWKTSEGFFGSFWFVRGFSKRLKAISSQELVKNRQGNGNELKNIIKMTPNLIESYAWERSGEILVTDRLEDPQKVAPAYAFFSPFGPTWLICGAILDQAGCQKRSQN